MEEKREGNLEKDEDEDEDEDEVDDTRRDKGGGVTKKASTAVGVFVCVFDLSSR